MEHEDILKMEVKTLEGISLTYFKSLKLSEHQFAHLWG